MSSGICLNLGRSKICRLVIGLERLYSCTILALLVLFSKISYLELFQSNTISDWQNNIVLPIRKCFTTMQKFETNNASSHDWLVNIPILVLLKGSID